MNKNISELDIKDKKLIYWLSVDAHLSHSQLSRKIGLSKNAVKYRIERLVKLGIIKNFTAVVNMGSLDIMTFTVLLRFKEDIYKNKDIIKFFNSHPFANWVISLSGQWDMFVEFGARDYNHIDEIIKGLIENFGESLNDYKFFFSQDPLRVEHMVGDYYSELNVGQLEHKKRKPIYVRIDKKDQKILKILTKDSSLNYHEIAEKLKLTIDVVRYRIKNLLKKKVIVKFFPEVDLKKLGYTEYLYTIKINNSSIDKINKIKTEIKNNSNVTYAFFDITNHSIIFICAYKNSEDIDNLARGLRNKFSEIITEQSYLIVKEQILFDLFPKGFLEA